MQAVRSLATFPRMATPVRHISNLPAWTSSLPIESLHQGLLQFHHQTGLPWWLTLAASTLTLRLSLLPLTMLSVRNSLRLGPLFQTITAISRSPEDASKKPKDDSQSQPPANANQTPAAQLAQNLHPVHRKGLLADVVNAAFRRGDVLGALFGSVSSILVHLPAFATMSFTVRSLVDAGSVHNGLLSAYSPDLLALQTEGLGWFTDLTVPDMYYTLPIINAGILLFNAHRAFGTNGPKWLLRVTQVSAMFPLIFAQQLPSGVYWYWCLSTFYTTLQSSLMKTQFMRTKITNGLTPIPVAEIVQQSPTLKIIEESYQSELNRIQQHVNDKMQIPASERDGFQSLDDINQYLQNEYAQGRISFPLQAAKVTSASGNESIVLALKSQLKQALDKNVQQMYVKYQADLQVVQALLAPFMDGSKTPSPQLCEEINAVLAQARAENKIVHGFRAVAERTPEGKYVIQVVSDVQLKMAKKE